MLETIGNDPGVVYAGFLIELFCGVMFANDDGQVACRIKKNLVAAYAVNGFKWDWFAVTGQFRKSLLLTDAVGIPCHMEALRMRTLVSAPLVSEAL